MEVGSVYLIGKYAVAFGAENDSEAKLMWERSEYGTVEIPWEGVWFTYGYVSEFTTHISRYDIEGPVSKSAINPYPVYPSDMPIVYMELSDRELNNIANLGEKEVDEVRVTSETGGKKGKKLAQLGAIDPAALLELAKVAGFGAEKYDRSNYLKGYDWSLSFDAAMRHLLEFWKGNDMDSESKLSHAAHAAWQCLALVSFQLHGVGTDDRFKKEEK